MSKIQWSEKDSLRRCIQAEMGKVRMAFGERRNTEVLVLGCSSLACVWS